ncbi:MAG TPA: hypothetical protein VF493_03470, partial [Terriglobales bacterium]
MKGILGGLWAKCTFRKQFFPFLVLLFVTYPLLLLAQTDLTGFWVLRVPTGDGNFRETFFDLKQEGEKLSGRVLAGTREIPIADGTLKDGKLHFVTRIGNGDQVRQTTYEGSLQGDKIDMSLQFMNREPVKGSA